MAGFGWLGLDGTYSRKQHRQGVGVLVGGKTAARPLGGRSGVTVAPSLAATSTVWTVGSFTALLDLETDATMGVTAAVFDGNSTGSVTAASSSFDRYDLLYVTMADSGPTPPTVMYTAGSVATTLPAVPANSMALAQITVPKSGTGSPTVALIAPRGVAAGGIIATPTSSGYPSDPYVGQHVDDAALGGLVRWDGSAWVQQTGPTIPSVVTSGVVTAAGGVTTVSTQQFYKLNGVVYLRVNMTLLAGLAAGNIANTTLCAVTDSRFTPLAGFTSYALSSADSGDMAAGHITPAGLIQVDATVRAFSIGDSISFGGSYPAAS